MQYKFLIILNLFSPEVTNNFAKRNQYHLRFPEKRLSYFLVFEYVLET